MKRLVFTLTMMLSIWNGQAQVSRTVESSAPGSLMYVIYPDMKTITDLTITGSLNAIDFKIIRDSMPALKNLDLKAVMIEPYFGPEGPATSPTNPALPYNYKALEIPSRAFMNRTNFETLVLPDSAKSIGNSAFYRFSAKNPINIPKKLLTTGPVFVYCATPFTVDPENIALSAVDGVLYNKTQTQLIQVPISKVGDFTIPSTVTTINPSALNGCDALSTVLIPPSVTTIMGIAFNNCSAQINVDANNAAFSSIDGVLFNKTQTTIIQVPSSKTGSYRIPTTVTTIASNSFTNCSRLTSITIPQYTSSIGSYSFSGCTGLTSIRVLTPTPLTLTGVPFQNVDTTNCILQVSGGTIDAYKSANIWKSFKNIVEILSTNAVSSITFNSAVFNGNIVSLGTSPITSYGFCWNTTGSPTVADYKVDNGANTALGAYSNSITGLTEGTKYYVKAYTTNNEETVYGNQVIFTTQSIPDDAGVISGSTIVCHGQNEITYTVPIIKNATSYSWTLPTGATGTSSTNSITVNYANNAVSGNITVKGHNEWYDGLASTLAITVNMFPARPGTISGNQSVCQGENSVTYTIPAIDNTLSYSWTLPSGASGTSTTNSINVNFSTSALSGNISVKGYNDCGYGEVSTLPITVNQLPKIELRDTAVRCGNSIGLFANVSYTGSGTLKYKWTPSTGLNNDTIANPICSATSNTTYTVTVTSPSGCTASENVTVSMLPMLQPKIGIVGVTSTNKNRIVWNKPVSTGIASYNIYKETNTSNVFEKIGTVPYDSLSVFVDNQSLPDVKSNKYKLSIFDRNGIESPLSDAHKTMHLSINKGQNTTWNLIWEAYEGFNVSTYNIYRGTNANNLNFIDATSGSSTQYSDLSAPTGDVYYQLEVISSILINPSKAPASIQKSKGSENSTGASLVSYNSSRSNIATHTVSGVNELNGDSKQINIYPNPVKDQLRIEFEGGSTFEILSLMGQIVYSGDLTKNTIVQTSNLSSGVYLIKFKAGKTFEYKRLIKE